MRAQRSFPFVGAARGVLMSCVCGRDVRYLIAKSEADMEAEMKASVTGTGASQHSKRPKEGMHAGKAALGLK